MSIVAPVVPAPAQPSKSIFASKTFWLNVLGVVAMVIPGLNIPAAVMAPVMAGLNVGTRLLTNGPAHIVDAPTN